MPHTFWLTSMVLGCALFDRFNFSFALFAYAILCYGLLLLAYIDGYYYLLPDALTLPLLWVGLLYHAYGMGIGASFAIVGAVAGYLSLWVLAFLFRICRGKIGMGGGDMKLFALLGAWQGPGPLPGILLLACICGILVGGVQMALKRHSYSAPLPFGPYLIIAGFCVLFFPDSCVTISHTWDISG